MKKKTIGLSRRQFIKGSAAAAGLFHIVPRHVLGGPGQTPPSETLGGALIGCGGRGGGTWSDMCRGLNVRKLASCDVRFVDKADNKTIYTDFRRVLERKDIDVVAIATPPHWHALISIAAAQAGKDVMCEKPMTRTIAEGRAVVEAFNRYKRIFQVCTFGRFGQAGKDSARQTRKLMLSGLLNPNSGVYVRRGGFKVKEWAGRVGLKTAAVPANLDWDMYCGPAPLKPYTPDRVGGTHRWFWDYEQGGLGDMGQHVLDPLTWLFGKDHTAPVKVEASAPPAHPEVAGLWAWVKFTYADGFTLVLESGEYGQPSGLSSKPVRVEDLSEADRKKLDAMADPEPLNDFATAVKTRKPAGGHPEAAHRTATLLHLANIAIRTGRPLQFDPQAERIVGDEEANRLVNPPMRAPWHL